MASQGAVSNGKTTEHNSLNHKESTNDRPIISQQPNQTTSPARPPVAAKPRRKPPAPSPKPGKPPAPPIPSHNTSHISPSSPTSPSLNSISSAKSAQSKEEQKNEQKHEQPRVDCDKKAIQHINEEQNVDCQNARERKESYDPSINPFEEEFEIEVSSCGNPFEEETDGPIYTNPFEEDETKNSQNGNPFEGELENSTSTNSFEAKKDIPSCSLGEQNSEVDPEQQENEPPTASSRSQQPPPLPTSPPSKARLSRSLSGFKVNSLNKNDTASSDINAHASSRTPQTQETTALPQSPPSPVSNTSTSLPPVSSSHNVISTPPLKTAQSPRVGPSPPPPIRPKPPTSVKPSPVSKSKSNPVVASKKRSNEVSSLNPPPRKSKEIKNRTLLAKVPPVSTLPTDSPENQSSNTVSSISSTSEPQPTEDKSSIMCEVKPATTAPPPVPKKSPKLIQKQSKIALSNSDTKHSSPPPRPLSPPSKSQSPPPAALKTTENTPTDVDESIPQKPKYVEKDDDLNLSATDQAPISNPQNHDLSPAHTPSNPDLIESTDDLSKPSERNDESLNSSIAIAETKSKQQDKEIDKKKVPPPLPKNPPRGRPLRRSSSGPAVQPDTPPPPPPPRVPNLSSPLRSLSLQEESLSLTKEPDKSEIIKSPVFHIEKNTRDCDGSNSNHLPVAPLRKSRSSTIDGGVQQELEVRLKSLTNTIKSEKVNEPISTSSIKSFSEEIANREEDSQSVQSAEIENENKSKDIPVTSGGQPRPVPRKRLSRNSVEISKDQQELKSQGIIVSESDNQHRKERIIIEHEYSEVYRGDSPEKTPGVDETCDKSQQSSLEKFDTNTEDSYNATSGEKHSEQDLVDSDNTAISPKVSPTKSNRESNASKDEPEATCDMLKEIEELLKNKLGVSNESALRSLSNDDINERFSGQDQDKDSDLDNNKEGKEEGEEEEPVRPPRPKRDASLNREHSESLNDLNSPRNERRLSSASDFGSSDGTKSAPPKPKRTTLPRVKRSVSDVTGSKCDFEGYEKRSDSETYNSADDSKPALPPRNESLRKGVLYQSRQQALLSADPTAPPPLPPRNKPRSASMNASSSSQSDDPPPKPILSTNAALKDENTTTTTTKAKTASPRRGDMSSFTKGALPLSATGQGGVNRSPAPRPARKAPPPPPHAPKRNATFGPGDEKSPVSTLTRKLSEDSKSNTPQASREGSPLKSNTTPGTTPKTSVSTSTPKVKKSRSLFHKFSSKKSEEAENPPTPVILADEGAEYHEISDHSKKTEQSGASSQQHEGSRVKKSPPPKLPPRPKIISPTRTSHKDDSDGKDHSSIKDNTESSATSTEEDQSARERRAQFALIQKVSQDIANNAAQSSIDFESPSSSESKESEKDGLIVDENKDDVKIFNEDKKDASQEECDYEEEVSSLLDEINAVVKREGYANNKKNLTVNLLGGRDRRVSSVSTYSTASEQDDDEGGAAMEDASSHSDTDPEDAEAIYAERKAKKVFNIAQEIASSERTFVDVLKLLNVDFRLHVSKETEKQGQPVIPNETLNKILDFLPQLQNFNEDLLKDLEHRVEHWEDNPCMSDIFVKKGPFLKLYSSYIRSFENSTAILDDACKKNPLFAAAVKDFETGPKCGKLALKHFMLKPIQRIPQYKLLLQEYLKNLHPHSQDYKNTTIALNIVTEVADHANESMRHGDNVQKLLEIQRSLIGQFEVIQPGREFIKQGELQKVSRKVMQPRWFFLFSDVLLYTTPVTSGFKLNNILPLSGMKINNPKMEVTKHEFNIIGVQRSFTLCASSAQDKKEWLEALHNALDENMKRFNTFETGKGPQTSLIDKDFVLGAKAPLWVPDDRVTMCMLCLSEFTITWRRHHCRSCGRIICHQCSNNKAPLRYLQYKPARVCNRCYDKLHSDMLKESQQQQNSDSRLWRKSSFRGNEDLSKPTSPTSPTDNSGNSSSTKQDDGDNNDSSLGFSRLLNRFHRIRKSGDKRNFRPSVLKEVHANDDGSDMSGYLRTFRSKKWKKLWFVVKGKVLYTYKASEDMAAIDSTPLLGYEVTRMNVWYEGAEPDLLFELSHQNTQPLVSKTSGDPMTSPRVMPDLEKTKQRLVFRTDSAAAVTKWLDVLRAATCT